MPKNCKILRSRLGISGLEIIGQWLAGQKVIGLWALSLTLLFSIVFGNGPLTQNSEYDSSPPLTRLSGTWQWPSQSTTLIRAFIVPAKIGDMQHRGLDIAYPALGQLLSPAAGTVLFSGMVVDRQVLTIEHSGDLVSTFEPIASNLVAGDRLKQGQLIGEVAADGSHCSQSCFHFGVRYLGKYINPLLLLGELPRSVLYPIASPVLR